MRNVSKERKPKITHKQLQLLVIREVATAHSRDFARFRSVETIDRLWPDMFTAKELFIIARYNDMNQTYAEMAEKYTVAK